MITRRSLLAAGTCVLGAPFINQGRFRLFGQSPAEYSAATLEVVRNSNVIDMLGLLTLDFRKLWRWQSNETPFPASELRRLKESGINVIHPAPGYRRGDIYQSTLRDITQWNAFLQSHRDSFLRVDRAADLARAKDEGKIGVVIGQQNSSHFRTPADVDRFYALGQRVSQLAYDRNRLGGGCTDPGDPGLTEYGGAVVARMNEIGMAVDVSHCGDRTTLDAIAASTKPVLVTHSNCRVLMPSSARCKSDAAIQAMAAKGGVMGITLVRFFVTAKNPATIENVLDHVDYIARLVGIEHVGLGTDVDLDGRDRGPVARRSDLDGLAYQRKVYDIAEGLLRRGYSPSQVGLVLGGNFQRVLSAIWS